MWVSNILSVFWAGLTLTTGQTDFPGCFDLSLSIEEQWVYELVTLERARKQLWEHLQLSAEMMEIAKLHVQDLYMWYDIETDYCTQYLVWSGNNSPLRSWTPCCYNQRDIECLKNKGREILQRQDGHPYPVYAATLRYHKRIETRDEAWDLIVDNPKYMQPLWENGTFEGILPKHMGVAVYLDWVVIYTTTHSEFEKCNVANTPSPYIAPPHVYPPNPDNVCVTVCENSHGQTNSSTSTEEQVASFVMQAQSKTERRLLTEGQHRKLPDSVEDINKNRPRNPLTKTI